MVLLAYIVVAALVVAGLAALGRKRTMTREEYDDRLGHGAGSGSALLELHGILEPGREQVRRVREEREDAGDESGDPPDPDVESPRPRPR